MVKLDEVTNESCFPRGGGSEKPKKEKKSDFGSFPDKKGQKRKATAIVENEVKKAKETTSWIAKVDSGMFIEGLLGMGVVSDVYEDAIILHTSSVESVKIEASEISKKFGQLLNEEKIEMKTAFQIGQMVPFRILAKKTGDKKGSVKATCNPAKLNKHLSPNMVVAGLVIHSSVVSIEEKGAILDIGLDQMTGFIEKDQQPAGGLKEGQPLMVRILSTTSRVAKVTSFVEQDNLNMTSCEKLQLNHLMPGTILECEPTGDEPLVSGVFVSIGNGLKGILPRRNLPPRLRERPESLVKTIRAVVMFCQQNSKILVLNAHPDIIAISKIEKRTNFDGISIGDKLKCTVMDVVPSKFTVSFALPVKDGKKSLVTAISSRGFLEKADKIADEYKSGAEKLCRVVGFKYADRSIVVSTRKDILHQKITSYKDAVCGDVVEGKVLSVTKTGVHLLACNFVRAFAPLILLSDTPITKKLKAKYPIGSAVKCRIWEINEERKSLIVTLREKMIAVKGPSANSVEQLSVGNTVPCMIKKVFPSGVLLMKTYNNIFGVVLRQNAGLIQNAKLNDFVEANIEQIDENKRLVFVPTAASTKNGEESATGAVEKKVTQKPKAVDENISIGKIYSGTLSAKKDDKANVTFEVKGGKDVYANVEDSMLSDLLDAPIGVTKRILIEGKQEIDRIVPMGRISAINRASIKRCVSNWVESQKVPKKFEDLVESQVVCGIVTQVSSDNGVFAELVGGSGLLAKVFERKEAKSASELFEIGQAIIGKISSLDEAKKQFYVDSFVEMDNGEIMLKTHAIPILKNIVEELKWLAENSKYPLPGSIVKAKITKELDDLCLVEFEYNGKKLAGVVPKQSGTKLATPKKKKGESFVIVDISHGTNEVILAPKSEKSTIVAVRRDYLCAVDSEGLVYLPTRFHPNHLAVLDSSVKVHDLVDLSNIEKVGSVRVATRSGGDVDDATRAKAIAVTFSGEEKKSKADSKSNKGDSIKNFGVYEATVVGAVKVEPTQKKNGLFAQLELPGGNIGRLHVSEMPFRVLNPNEKPLESFLKRNLNKKVYVRIIGFTKFGKSRIAELTMNHAKIRAGKVRAAQLSYKNTYNVGDIVRCFGAATLREGQESEIRVEVNGVWSGRIPRENLSDDLKVESAGGEVVDISIARGEMREARVIGVEKHVQCLQLSLKLSKTLEDFQIGAVVTGRVFSTEAGNIKLKLSSGEQAVLAPTGVGHKYESFEEYFEKKCSVGALMDVVCANITEKPKRCFVVTKERFEELNDCDNENRKLILDEDEVEKGFEYDGIVRASTKTGLVVEIGPGISGLIKVTETNEELLEVGVNSVVHVKVAEKSKQGLVLELKEIIIRKWASAKTNKKRSASTKSEEVPKKIAHIEEDEDAVKETVEVEDPGFDWSNKGFRSEDLAAVGKLTDRAGEEDSEEEDDEEEEEGSDEEEEEEQEEVEVEKTPKKQKKQKKTDISEIEDNEEDISKQLRSDPNSAILWIKYMSLFLEKSDLSAARAAADRAIETINYRESGELRNMWTAYLNMEVAFGDASTVQKVFERACNNADSYTMHLQLALIYQNSDKNAEARQILETMVKKFRAQNMEVWTLLAEHLMKQNEHKTARELLQRALSSVPKQQHTQLISKFAQLEFKNGDSERGTTLFEGLITAHPKKNDLWLVYADAALKHLGIEQTRKILERACNLGTSLHKMRPLYKKWLEIENKHGDAAAIELVKSKAEKYLQSVADSVLEEKD